MRGVFITATDTGAGKTLFGLMLASYLKEKNIPVKVIKPFETGCIKSKKGLVPSDGLLYKTVLELEDTIDNIVPYRFGKPLAPFQASVIDGRPVKLKEVALKILNKAEDDVYCIFEGAGGIFVPVEERLFILDFIQMLGIPVIVISDNRLGAINHTILTIEAITKRNIELSGVVLNNKSNIKDISKKLNVEYLAKLLGTDYLGEVPFISSVGKIEKRLKVIADKKLKISQCEVRTARKLLAGIFKEFICTDKFKFF